jgi:hypothetical protein
MARGTPVVARNADRMVPAEVTSGLAPDPFDDMRAATPLAI